MLTFSPRSSRRSADYIPPRQAAEQKKCPGGGVGHDASGRARRAGRFRRWCKRRPERRRRALLSILATQPMSAKDTQGQQSTTPNQAKMRPVPEDEHLAGGSSICHQEMAAATTARATRPVTIWPVMLFRKSIRVNINRCGDNGVTNGAISIKRCRSDERRQD